MKKKGFTVIELAVVIGIIGLLATIVTVSLGGARAKARDAKREADLKNIQAAIDLFIREGRGVLGGVSAPGSPPGTGAGWWAQLNNTCAIWQPSPYSQLRPEYFAKLPEDPSSPGTPPACTSADGYWYYYGRGRHWDGTTLTNPVDPYSYVLCTKLENNKSYGYVTIANPWNAAWTLNYCVGN